MSAYKATCVVPDQPTENFVFETDQLSELQEVLPTLISQFSFVSVMSPGKVQHFRNRAPYSVATWAEVRKNLEARRNS